MVGGSGWMKATLVFIFGPNLKTKTLLRPRPKPNNIISAKALIATLCKPNPAGPCILHNSYINSFLLNPRGVLNQGYSRSKTI